MNETVFTLEATPVKFGPGAVDDAGWELARLGVTRALLVTDPGVAAAGHPERVRASIEADGIEVVVFDRARVEPTLASLEEAAALRARRRASTASSRSAAARRWTPRRSPTSSSPTPRR